MNYQIKHNKNFKYAEAGEGPVLILLHGLFGTVENWKEVMDKFSPKYRVVIPFMPIYDLPLPLTNVQYLAELIHKFTVYKGYESYNLIGNSLGGHVALVYAAKYPQKVTSMILVASSGLYENSFVGGTYPRRKDYNFVRERAEYTFYDPANATKELVDEVYEIINNRKKAHKILAMVKSVMQCNMSNELPKIHIPTCLIWGKNDIITPPEVAEEFHQLLPNSELFWIDRCGHAPMMEHPQEFNDILSKWLAQQLGR